MSLLTARLAAQSLNHLSLEAAKAAIVAQQSFESELVELQDGIDTGIAQIDEQVAGFAETSADIHRTETGTDNLAGLVENTIAVYGENGITEDGAKALEVSVESLLRSMGVDSIVPVSVVLPTFEGKSRTDYSTEAEEKKEGVVARLWEWLKTLYAKLAEFAEGIVDKIRLSTTAVQNYSKRVREAANKATGAAPDTKLKLGGDTAFVRSGDAASVVSETANDYAAFVKSWSTVWEALVNTDPTSTDPEQVLKLITAAGSKLPSEKSFKFTPFHSVEIAPGSGENTIIGAKASVKIDKSNAATELAVLSAEQMKSALDAVDRTLVDLTNAQEQISKWNLNLKRIASKGATTSASAWVSSKVGTTETKSISGEVRKMGQALNSAARIALDGFSMSFTPTLKVLRANLIYIAKSASAHSAGASAEKPAEAAPAAKPDDKKE